MANSSNAERFTSCLLVNSIQSAELLPGSILAGGENNERPERCKIWPIFKDWSKLISYTTECLRSTS